MSRITVTRREFQRAYRNHYQAYDNMHKRDIERYTYLLLLFYAVECGLKALWLKQNNKEDTRSCSDGFNEFGHNINAILDYFKVHRGLRLPRQTKVSNPATKPIRDVSSKDLNQAWRYGCQLDDDGLLEERLKEIIIWIGREL